MWIERDGNKLPDSGMKAKDGEHPGLVRIRYLDEQWNMVRPSERVALQRERLEKQHAALTAFVEKYMTKDTFEDEYDGMFKRVQSEAKSLLASTMEINKKNGAFYIQVEKLVAEKRGLKDGFKCWKRTNRDKKRADFDKLTPAEKQMARNKAISEYAATLKEVWLALFRFTNRK